jgi:hypothetical protein
MQVPTWQPDPSVSFLKITARKPDGWRHVSSKASAICCFSVSGDCVGSWQVNP